MYHNDVWGPLVSHRIGKTCVVDSVPEADLDSASPATGWVELQDGRRAGRDSGVVRGAGGRKGGGAAGARAGQGAETGGLRAARERSSGRAGRRVAGERRRRPEPGASRVASMAAEGGAQFGRRGAGMVKGQGCRLEGRG